MDKRIGVLSLQGAFFAQYQFLNQLNCEEVKVQKREDLIGISGLIITGTKCQGGFLESGLGDKIKELALIDFPIFGIGAGMVLLSKVSQGRADFQLGLMDIKVSREPLLDEEIETYLSIPAMGTVPVKARLNSMPYIEEIAPNVGILAEYNGKIVFVRQGNMLASAFYPEQSADDRIHRYFLDIVNGQI